MTLGEEPLTSPATTDRPVKPNGLALRDGEMVNNDIASPDDAESVVLSPPPDTMSPVSEVMNEGPEDEIVVGSVKDKSTNVKKSAVASEKSQNADAMDIDNEDHEIDKAKDTDKEPEQRPKRKRASLYEDLAEEKMDKSILDETADDLTPVPGVVQPKGVAPAHGTTNATAVILGYWRESEAPDPDQHIVKGFIDSRDRLRTRIQPYNREGKVVTGSYPLKPGPGGSWVTFHNIVFDQHLWHLDQHQVKEYVKIRAEMAAKGPEEDSKGIDTLAVQQAIKTCQTRDGPPEGALPPQIAYGPEIPEQARISYSRAEKRRRTANANAVAPSSTPDVQSPQISQGQPLQAAPATQPVLSTFLFAPDDLPGKRPTKILLGYWKDSAEPELANKHAVFGILGNNDMFRVKVGRETRDGRPMQSNFPQGAGALWINPHQWEREDYLRDLTREEIKEYCRVRQWQADHGERECDLAQNRRQAINEARRRAANLSTKPKSNGTTLSAGNTFTDGIITQEAPAHETRQALARRSGPAITPATGTHQSPQTPAFRAANRSIGVDPRLERANSLALNAVSRIEANQAKVEERDAYAAAQHAANGGGRGDSFRENIGRLNTVWSQQEAYRIRTGNEDAKMHMGIKYERKQNGPFAGKLVSQGAIISIDGEDYVEYRVLTKPAFI